MIQLSAGLKRLSQYDWLVLVATAPVLLLTERFPAPVVAAALGLLGLYFVAHLLVWRKTSATPLHLPLLFVALMLPFSLFASSDLQLSMPKLAGLLFGIAIYLALSSLPAQARTGPIQIAILLLLELGLILVGLFATELSSKITWVSWIVVRLTQGFRLAVNSSSTGFHPNEVAGALILLIPLTLALFVTLALTRARDDYDETKRQLASSRTKHIATIGLLGLVSLLSVFTLILTQSRSALIGLVFALVLLLSSSHKWVLGLFGIALTAAAVTVFVLGVGQVGQLFFNGAATDSVVGSFDFPMRIEIWQRAVYMLQDFPFTGIGLNTFPVVTNALYPLFQVSPDIQVQHAHNLILQVGVDLGIPGLVAYTGMIAAFLAMAWQLHRKTTNPVYRALIAGLAGGMVALQVYGLTDAIPLGGRAALPFWVILGVMGWLWANVNSEYIGPIATSTSKGQSRERTLA